MTCCKMSSVIYDFLRETRSIVPPKYILNLNFFAYACATSVE